MNSLFKSFKQTGKVIPAALFAMIIVLAAACSSQPEKVLFTSSLDKLKVQSFTVDASTNEVVVGEAGSIFAIPAGVFRDAMGNEVTGKVEIKIQEARDLKTMFESGLQTVSDEGLLTTDGSYSITAFQNGKELGIDPDMGIFAYFPSDGVDPEMNLYAGEIADDLVNWKLADENQTGIPVCDGTKKTKKECKKCKGLVKMNKRIKVGKKPAKNEYWVKRYYWENGVMYFASSGSSKPIMSKRQIEECRKYLEMTEAGQELLAKVEQIKKNQLADISGFYSFRLRSTGWHNVDKLVKADLVAFNGKVVDEDGNVMAGATVHVYSKEQKIHMVRTAKDGSFDFMYLPNEKFKIYAYRGQHVGKEELQIRSSESTIDNLVVRKIDEEDFDDFLKDLI